MSAAKRKTSRSRKKLRYEDLVSTRPGSLAGKFMRRFWHPICRAEELQAGQAKPIQIMSERFTLYRGDSGTPHVVDFRCPHRGTQLSAGSVEGDSIRCMYHGWRFNQSGQCTEQPAEEKSFAAKIRIRSYPTREYLGLIFACFGEGAAPAFPRYRHMEEDGVLEVLSTETWPCNFFQRIDNNGDTYHVPFVHRGAYSASSANNRSGLPEISKEESPWGTTGYASFAQGWRNVFQFFMPNVYAFRNLLLNPSACRKTACSGTFRSMTNMRWSFACAAYRYPGKPRAHTARVKTLRPGNRNFPSRKWARRYSPAS